MYKTVQKRSKDINCKVGKAITLYGATFKNLLFDRAPKLIRILGAPIIFSSTGHIAHRVIG